MLHVEGKQLLCLLFLIPGTAEMGEPWKLKNDPEKIHDARTTLKTLHRIAATAVITHDILPQLGERKRWSFSWKQKCWNLGMDYWSSSTTIAIERSLEVCK